MTPFPDFIAEMPGVERYALDMYAMIDREAVRVGEHIAATHDVAKLRATTGSPWLHRRNSEMADALERDVRLAAIPTLRAWAAMPGGIGNTWVNWYVPLLKAHIARRHREAA